MFPFDESIPSRPARIRRLLDQLLAWVAVISAMVKIAAAELTISDIRVQPNQPVQIRVPAAHDSYYLLFRGEQVQQIVAAAGPPPRADSGSYPDPDPVPLARHRLLPRRTLFPPMRPGTATATALTTCMNSGTAPFSIPWCRSIPRKIPMRTA